MIGNNHLSPCTLWCVKYVLLFSFPAEGDDREDMQLNKTTRTKEVYIMTLSEPCENSSASKHSEQRTISHKVVWVVFYYWEGPLTNHTSSDGGAVPTVTVLFDAIIVPLCWWFFFPPVHVFLSFYIQCWVLFCWMKVCFLFDVFFYGLNIHVAYKWSMILHMRCCFLHHKHVYKNITSISLCVITGSDGILTRWIHRLVYLF